MISAVEGALEMHPALPGSRGWPPADFAWLPAKWTDESELYPPPSLAIRGTTGAEPVRASARIRTCSTLGRHPNPAIGRHLNTGHRE